MRTFSRPPEDMRNACYPQIARSTSALAIYRQSKSVSLPQHNKRPVIEQNQLPTFLNSYSILSTRIGSVDAARRAGTIAANVAATRSSKTLPPTANGSVTDV
jgi:hypothetical protein